MKENRINTAELFPLHEYHKIIVMFSGGKDSLACLLHLLDLGISKNQIELWHQCVDGAPGSEIFMDWAITESYVKAIGAAFGVPVLFQWKEKGFQGEMLREDSLTQPSSFQTLTGGVMTVGGVRGKFATRRMFPQKTADLSVRWCSPYLKIDVAAAAIRNDPRFAESKILVVTGERREESAARARYAEIELLLKASNSRRIVHQLRPVIDWSESRVWQIIEKHLVHAHPCYFMGYGRASCMFCIFLNADGMATNRQLAPNRFALFAQFEREFGKTIDRKLTISELADKGTPFDYSEEMKAIALSNHFPVEMVFMKSWVRPSGAFTDCGGSI